MITHQPNTSVIISRDFLKRPNEVASRLQNAGMKIFKVYNDGVITGDADSKIHYDLRQVEGVSAVFQNLED